jgi:hypothetical protein
MLRSIGCGSSLVKKISSEPEKRKISKQTLSLLRNWAIEAHKIDPSKPVSRYYEYFMDRYNGNSDKIQKDEFFKESIINT